MQNAQLALVVVASCAVSVMVTSTIFLYKFRESLIDDVKVDSENEKNEEEQINLEISSSCDIDAMLDDVELNIVKKKSKLILRTKFARDFLFSAGRDANGVNNIKRGLSESCYELDRIDRESELSTVSPDMAKATAVLNYSNRAICYGCSRTVRRTHPVYVYSCFKCGALFQKNRTLSRNLTGQIFVVIGCRSKLGHMTTLKLLRAGATVLGTTRRGGDAVEMFSEYYDADKWIKNLVVEDLDLDVVDLEVRFKALRSKIENTMNFPFLNGFIYCAAQTIRSKEKMRELALENVAGRNRYRDAKYAPTSVLNSWTMTVMDCEQHEYEECMRINAIGPALLLKTFQPLLAKCETAPFIIFTHAREGLFRPHKAPIHPQTNMAKAALHMLTRTIRTDSSLYTHQGLKFKVFGVDPGWISVDEYFEKERPFEVAPLDEVDGASRIVYPIMANMANGASVTMRHYGQFVI